MLDLSRVLAGPLATMILGDLGADVLKVERPGGGDETRGWGPPFDDRGESAYYLAINRNKLAVAADLGDDADRRFVRSLIAGADVVIDNFKRGALERFGLDPARVLAEHPRLIWCTVSGFGPDSDRPGYDFVAQAEFGWMSITGFPDGQPVKVGVAITDILTGKDAAIAVLAALVERARTGRGRHLHVSLATSAVAGLINVAQNALVSGVDARRWGNAQPNIVPYQLFETADRPIVLAARNDAQWRAAIDALELPDAARDERFASNAGRLRHRREVADLVAEHLRARPAAEWLAALERAGVPCGIVRSVLEVLREVEASPLTGLPPSVPGTVRRPPPRLDEHGALVRAHGWDAFSAA